jgi:hypothetical protein
MELGTNFILRWFTNKWAAVLANMHTNGKFHDPAALPTTPSDFQESSELTWITHFTT